MSGNYGVGKSSILQEVAQRQNGRVVELSLSTLAPIEASRLNESVPIQATTPTNRIQQEIVKQLLYRENPSKMPASRFRRIERFQLKREIGTAVLLGFVIAVIFLLTGWTTKIISVWKSQEDISLWSHLIVCGIATLATVLARWLCYGKLHIKQLSAGSATVTLNDNSVSYFDQYLDEIVYFFDVSGHDVVIFEDIDRFNDSHIFETLRALNTLLNASPQIRKPIRFIYAIKDSIFDRIGLEAEGRKIEPNVLEIDDPAQSETMRANRTKFFDLIIPVVPFITHRSARNLAVQLLGQIEHKVEPELLDLAAQYVPDMRLLKNVRNEFIIFRNRIFSGDGEYLNLSETDLFAMMLYKSTHLTDFETIRLGTSKLDVLYKVSRELVTENIRQAERERRVLRQRLARIDGAATRSAQLGENLIAHMQRTAEAANCPFQDPTFTFNRVNRSLDDLKEADFWIEFATAEANDAVLKLNISIRYSHLSLSFSRKNLAAALGDPLDVERWNGADREALDEQINGKTQDINFLRSADLGDLVKRSEFLAKHEENIESLEAIAKKLLKPGLAYQLIRAGYLNRNFTLYTSTFHGNRVSPAATNFIIHHVERDLMDEHFELAPGDVDAVVRERGKNALKEPALYNIAILDRLLTVDINASDIMISSLTYLGESQTRFLQAYLAAGEKRLKLIERLTVASKRVLIYLVSQIDLDDPSRLELLDVALMHLPASKQRTDARVSEYLLAHYAELSVLTSDATELAQAERIGALFAGAGITLPHLKPLGRHIRPSFVSLNLYEVTYENLSIAIDNKATLALDVIHAADDTVYDYVLEHLSTYLDAVNGASVTIFANENFLSVIEDVLEQESSLLGDVIKHAALCCEIAALSEVPDAAWQALAEHKRFPATFNNISRYIVIFGSVDASLARTLAAASEITEIVAASEEEKITLAIAILATNNQLLSAVQRSKLVASLSLKEYLDVDEIAVEVGELFALLLNQNIIADSARSYEHLKAADWVTREAFIRESMSFASYMTSDLIGQDLAMLLTSDEIDLTIKDVVVEKAIEYSEVAGLDGLNELAQYAIRYNREIPPDVVQKMAEEGVTAQHIVVLLEPHLEEISFDQLSGVLSALNGDYPNLTVAGRDKPRISNTSSDRALLERLKQDGIVTKYDELGSQTKVHKRYK